MSDVKQAFIDKLNHPETFPLDTFTRAVEQIDTIAVPTTTDDAQIAVGVYCANANKFLKLFEGIPILDLLLSGCTRTPVFQGLLLASLETILSQSGNLTILAPTQGAVYYGYFSEFQATANITLVAVSVTVGNIGTADLTESQGIWSCLFPIPLGIHTAVFTSEDETGETYTDSVSFEVRSFETSPQDGETVSAGEITLQVKGESAEINSAQATISGNIVTLTHVGGNLWEATYIIDVSAHDILFQMFLASGDIVDQFVNIEVN